MDSWAAIIGTLIGVIAGGAISFVNNSQKINAERKAVIDSLKIQKIERAHEVLSIISLKYRSYFALDGSILHFSYDPNDHDFESVPFEELDMIFSLYIQDLSADSLNIVVCSQIYNGHSLKLSHARPNTPKELSSLYQQLDCSHNELQTHIRLLQTQLSILISQHLKM